MLKYREEEANHEQDKVQRLQAAAERIRRKNHSEMKKEQNA